jgi:hypothetical protein
MSISGNGWGRIGPNTKCAPAAFNGLDLQKAAVLERIAFGLAFKQVLVRRSHREAASARPFGDRHSPQSGR